MWGRRQGFCACIVVLVWGCSSSPENTASSGGGNGTRDGGAGSDGSAQADAAQINTSCGDNGIQVGEECDDGNADAGDGCSAACVVEPGYRCPPNGGPCRAAKCGDGIVAGAEQCEDGNDATGDGCAPDCTFENGWVCDNTSAPSVCRKTVCNDGKREGSEPCDDGNSVIGDGCNPLCQVEPSCGDGACKSACGDGLKLASDTQEECDDGNTKNGDGCSSTCKVEKAYRCKDVVGTLPDSFPLPVVFRDFIRSGKNGGQRHPDFEIFGGDDATEGMVEASLGANRKPVYTGICERNNQKGPCPEGDQTTSKANFDQWYSDDTTVFTVPNLMGTVEGIRNPTSGTITGTMLKFVDMLPMNRVPGSDAYRNATFGNQLFPLNGRGWVQAGLENPDGANNFSFTSEIRHWFEFKGGETLTFSGDDDVWVFIGGKLALDLGGLHPKRERTIVLDAASGDAQCFLNVDAQGNTANPCSTPTRELNLVPNQVYEMALFHAERHTGESNFDLTLTGFVAARSVCESTCGDGVLQAEQGEQCDDGNRDDDDDCDRNCQAFALQ